MLGIHSSRPFMGLCLRSSRMPRLHVGLHTRVLASQLPQSTFLRGRTLSTSPPLHETAKNASSSNTSENKPAVTTLASLDTPATSTTLNTLPAPGRIARLLPAAFRAEPGSSKALRKMVALARPEKKPLLLAVGLLLVSSSVTMTVPLTIGKLIDYFSSPDPTIPLGLSLPQASGLLLALFTIGAGANAGRAILMKISGQRIVTRLRESMYSAALRQEVEFVERGEGDVLSRLSSDTYLVGESLTQNLSDGFRSIITASAGLGAMFWLSPSLTLLMLTVVPPVSLGAVFYGRYLKRLSNKTQEALGDMSKVAQEALSALRTVQAFNAQPYEQSKFDERVNHVFSLARKEAIASGIFFGSTGWSGNVTMLALLGYGGSQVASGLITVGDLTSLLMYTVYVGSGLQMLTTFFASIMRGLGATNRIFGLLDRDPAIPATTSQAIPVPKPVPTAASRGGILRFEGVGFAYPSRPSARILDKFTLEVNAGESVALVGMSGSGKSSVNALLLRYYDPDAGKVTFDGIDIRQFDVSEWRASIGVVPQDPILFRGTIADNIAYGAPNTPREKIERAARAANCEFIWGMPQGFDTPIGRMSLSGGQRQRLAIARALLKRPAILALDEATSALDAASELRVNDAIDRVLRDGRTTCLIVAHRLSTIARADRIVVLEEGRITETGTYQQLVANEESRFRTLMSAQLAAAAGEKTTTHKSSVSSHHEHDSVSEEKEREEHKQGEGEASKS